MNSPEVFKIDTEQKASWAARKIREAKAYQQRVKDWAEREILRGQREEEWLLRRFGSDLKLWLRAELQRRACRQRSIALPGATLALRKLPESLQVLDENALLAWCQKHLIGAMCVTVQASGPLARQLLKWQTSHDEAQAKTRASRSVVTGHFRQTGELPDGTSPVPSQDRLYVK